MEALKSLKTHILSRVPPKVQWFCGRLWFLTMAILGLVTFVHLVSGTVPTIYKFADSTYGFWPQPPSTTIPFTGFGQNRCVPLFQGASTLAEKFPDTKFLFSYFAALSYIGVCTNAPIEIVDSIFGPKNRMFKSTIPDLKDVSERPFVTRGGVTAAGIVNIWKLDEACDSIEIPAICCEKESPLACPSFRDIVPQGFNSVSLWERFITVDPRYWESNRRDCANGAKCGMYVEDSGAPLCDPEAGFHPVFYYSMSASISTYSQFVAAILFIQTVFEAGALMIAFRCGYRTLVSGNFCPFFFIFTWFPFSPAYVDTNYEDDFSPSEFFGWVVCILDNLNLLFAGVVSTGLQLSGGCSSFPGRGEVVALLIFNILKLIYKIATWPKCRKYGIVYVGLQTPLL